eukprot:3708704-Prymnesium_polylepis.2
MGTLGTPVMSDVCRTVVCCQPLQHCESSLSQSRSRSPASSCGAGAGGSSSAPRAAGAGAAEVEGGLCRRISTEYAHSTCTVRYDHAWCRFHGVACVRATEAHLTCMQAAVPRPSPVLPLLLRRPPSWRSSHRARAAAAGTARASYRAVRAAAGGCPARAGHKPLSRPSAASRGRPAGNAGCPGRRRSAQELFHEELHAPCTAQVRRLELRVAHKQRPPRRIDGQLGLGVRHCPAGLAVEAERGLERAEALLQQPADVGLPGRPHVHLLQAKPHERPDPCPPGNLEGGEQDTTRFSSEYVRARV